MRRHLANQTLKIYYSFKRKVSDILWGTNNHGVPIATAIGGSIWFILEPAPEPAVVFITSFLAVLVSRKHNNDYWYTKTQGNLYEIGSRSDTLSEQERIELAKSFVANIDFLCKYKIVPAKGDSLNLLYIDTFDHNDSRFIEKARKQFVVYYINKNGKQIYEKEY